MNINIQKEVWHQNNLPVSIVSLSLNLPPQLLKQIYNTKILFPVENLSLKSKQRSVGYPGTVMALLHRSTLLAWQVGVADCKVHGLEDCRCLCSPSSLCSTFPQAQQKGSFQLSPLIFLCLTTQVYEPQGLFNSQNFLLVVYIRPFSSHQI